MGIWCIELGRGGWSRNRSAGLLGLWTATCGTAPPHASRPRTGLHTRLLIAPTRTPSASSSTARRRDTSTERSRALLRLRHFPPLRMRLLLVLALALLAVCLAEDSCASGDCSSGKQRGARVKRIFKTSCAVTASEDDSIL